ncbi:MAG: class C sortase [Clostridia bacterium]
MKRKVLKIILYICGIFCIVYPIYSKFLSYKNQTTSIYDYKKEIENMDQALLEEKRKNSEEFNRENSTETTVIDPNTINANDNLASSYSFLEVGETIGYITIPKINIELPIYEGVTINNLSKGVSHMENTSLPNGNINTHSILAGHTGISQAVIFDNLNELELEDEFYISYYGETTKYKVIEEKIVLPEETNGLKVEEGRCLVTLVTCTPKTVNSHRLLVTGQKVEEEPIVDEEEEENQQEQVIEEIQPKTDLELFMEFMKANKQTYIFILLIIIFFIIINIISKIRKTIKSRKKRE